MRRLQLTHITQYRYAETVTLLPHKLLLRPREGPELHIESSSLLIQPRHQLQWHRDVNDNAVAIATFTEPSNRLFIASHVLLQQYDSEPLNFLVEDYATYFPFHYDAVERLGLEPYLTVLYRQDQPGMDVWLRQFWQPGQRVETYLLLEWINKAIATGFTYKQREEPGVQSPAITLAKRAGSCRDFATLFIEACRHLGLAARFVSGYQYSATLLPEQGSTHAWSEVYLPGAGWKGFDSTSGDVVGDHHIAVAVSSNPELVPLVAGSFAAVNAQSPSMEVTVQVSDMQS